MYQLGGKCGEMNTKFMDRGSLHAPGLRHQYSESRAPTVCSPEVMRALTLATSAEGRPNCGGSALPGDLCQALPQHGALLEALCGGEGQQPDVARKEQRGEGQAKR